MAKPAMVIDFLSRGPGDEEEDEESPLDDEGDDAPKEDPAAIISELEAKLAQLRRAL